MPTSLLRGLAVLELVDRYAPIGITELARKVGADKASVSRLVAAAEVEGWFARQDGKVILGPRAALLGQATPTSLVVRHAEPLVHAIAGITGLLTQAVALVGQHAVALTSAAGPGVPAGSRLDFPMPLWAGAAGKVIAAQLEAEALDALLPAGPYPDPQTILREYRTPGIVAALFERPSAPAAGARTVVSSRRALDRQLTTIRRVGSFREYAELHAASGCIAVRWPQDGLPAALVCIGFLAEIEADADRIEAILRAAALPGASAADVVRVAAGLPATQA
jgi:DNA-binding IclR family transcriptional regulator